MLSWGIHGCLLQLLHKGICAGAQVDCRHAKCLAHDVGSLLKSFVLRLQHSRFDHVPCSLCQQCDIHHLCCHAVGCPCRNVRGLAQLAGWTREPAESTQRSWSEKWGAAADEHDAHLEHMEAGSLLHSSVMLLNGHVQSMTASEMHQLEMLQSSLANAEAFHAEQYDSWPAGNTDSMPPLHDAHTSWLQNQQDETEQHNMKALEIVRTHVEQLLLSRELSHSQIRWHLIEVACALGALPGAHAPPIAATSEHAERSESHNSQSEQPAPGASGAPELQAAVSEPHKGAEVPSADALPGSLSRYTAAQLQQLPLPQLLRACCDMVLQVRAAQHQRVLDIQKASTAAAQLQEWHRPSQTPAARQQAVSAGASAGQHAGTVHSTGDWTSANGSSRQVSGMARFQQRLAEGWSQLSLPVPYQPLGLPQKVALGCCGLVLAGLSAAWANEAASYRHGVLSMLDASMLLALLLTLAHRLSTDKSCMRRCQHDQARHNQP